MKNKITAIEVMIVIILVVIIVQGWQFFNKAEELPAPASHVASTIPQQEKTPTPYPNDVLFNAIEENDIEKVREVIKQFPKMVDFEDTGSALYFGRVPLNFAIECDAEEIAKFLIENGADVNSIDGDLQHIFILCKRHRNCKIPYRKRCPCQS